jgi:MFS family permease
MSAEPRVPHAEPATVSGTPVALSRPGEAQAWYLVFVLLIFYIFSFIDRQIISMLVEPMKRDLGLSDTQIGLLQGFTFAVFYTLFGIPIGRLADRMNRKTIIAAGVFIWSLMATFCGLARTTVQLFLARVGVGVGEATLSPAAYSMLTDAFPREKLGRAFSVYNMGIAIGSGVAFFIGGVVVHLISGAGQTIAVPLLGEVRAWQFVFIATGAPGLLLPLLLLSVREPARRGLMRTGGAGESASQKIPLRDVMSFMNANRRFYVPHFLAMAMMALLGYAVGQWLPTVMNRTYGIEPGQLGKILGLSTMTINTIGIFAAGRICDRLTSKGYSDAPIWVCLGTAVAVVVTSTLPAFMPTAVFGVTMMCIAGFPFHGYVAMGPMAVNQATPNQMRAQVSAVYLFTVNFIGMGAGPALVPFISDHILHDPSKIRWALLTVVASAGTIAAILLWFARAAYRRQMAASANWQ